MSCSICSFTFYGYFGILALKLSNLNFLKHIIYYLLEERICTFIKNYFRLRLSLVMFDTINVSKYLKQSDSNPPIAVTYSLVSLNGHDSNPIPPGVALNMNARSIWNMEPSLRIIILELFLSLRSRIYCTRQNPARVSLNLLLIFDILMLELSNDWCYK